MMSPLNGTFVAAPLPPLAGALLAALAPLMLLVLALAVVVVLFAGVPATGLSRPIAGGTAVCVALSVGELNTFVIVIGRIVVGDPIDMSGLPTVILGDPMCALSGAFDGTNDFGVPVPVVKEDIDVEDVVDVDVVDDGTDGDDDDDVMDVVDEGVDVDVVVVEEEEEVVVVVVDVVGVIVFGIWILLFSFLINFWKGFIVDPVVIGDATDWK